MPAAASRLAAMPQAPAPESPAPAPPAALQRAAAPRLRLLGGFSLQGADGRELPLPLRAAQLLLARLALWPGRRHPREELAELLWPGAEAVAARGRLRHALATLRAQLPQAVQASRDALWLADQALHCDATAFEAAVRAGQRAAAAQLYRGELLPGQYDDWVLERRAELAALAESVTATPRAPTRSTADPPPPSGLPVYLTRLLGVDTQAAQLAADLRTRRLVTLLGPGGAGKTRLAAEVLRRVADDADAGFDRIAFVPLAGCEQAMALHDAIGLGLGLGPAQGATAVGPAGLPDGAARLVAALAGQRTLLVLDNLEQLLPAGALAIAALLAALPSLHLLVTSRRALALDGERAWPLPPLPLPDDRDDLATLARCASVALFVDRVQAVRPGWRLAAIDAPAVCQLIRQLQGLPLALELAAARLRSLTPQALCEQLQAAERRDDGAALPLLARDGPRQGHDARGASLAAVAQWTLQLLQPAQRRALAPLALFRGGATLAQAAALLQLPVPAAAVLLDELVAHSALRPRDAPDGRRYPVYEALREAALAALDAAARARLRAAHRAAWVAWAMALASPPGADALPALRDALPDLLAALASAVDDGAPQQALQLLLALEPLLDDEPLPPGGVQTLCRALAALPPATPGLARAQALLAVQCFEAGLPDAAAAAAQQALQGAEALAAGAGQAGALGSDADRAQALALVARVAVRTRGAAGARDAAPLLQQAELLARRAGPAAADTLGRVLALRAVLAERLQHDHAANVALQAQALQVWQQAGLRLRVPAGQVNLAIALGFQHRVAEQLALLVPALRAAEAQSQGRLLAFAHSVHGYALADARRWPEAATAYRASLRSAWAGACWREWFYALWNLPRTLLHLRQPDSALLLMGFADAFYAQHFGTLGDEDLRERRRTRRLGRLLLGPAAEAEAWARGAQLARAEAQRLALQS